MLKHLPKPILRFIQWLLEVAFRIARPKIVPLYPYDRQSRTIRLPREIERELRRLVAAGNKVEAVKRVTRLTGAGLRVSKDYVDGLTEARKRRQ
jgi:hypothetical protein